MNLGPTSTWVTKAVASRDGTVSLHQAWATHGIAMEDFPGLRLKGTAGLLMDRYTGISDGSNNCAEKQGHELPRKYEEGLQHNTTGERLTPVCPRRQFLDYYTDEGNIVTFPQKRRNDIGSGYSKFADYKTMLGPVLMPHLTGSYNRPAEDAKNRTKLVFSLGSAASAMPRLSGQGIANMRIVFFLVLSVSLLSCSHVQVRPKGSVERSKKKMPVSYNYARPGLESSIGSNPACLSKTVRTGLSRTRYLECTVAFRPSVQVTRDAPPEPNTFGLSDGDAPVMNIKFFEGGKGCKKPFKRRRQRRISLNQIRVCAFAERVRRHEGEFDVAAQLIQSKFSQDAS
ncbi:hypothetical protein K438DRAFT_1750321 [Mycena galopus ATCC 62051]|nr:hypothetical protein K438DRAFT_1750321 [Mycena galopus ATCC 62051]